MRILIITYICIIHYPIIFLKSVSQSFRNCSEIQNEFVRQSLDEHMYFLYNKTDVILIRNEVNHMARGAGKNNWALFLLLLAGIVIGSFIAQATAGVSALSWLSYGQRFGLTHPFKLDLGILVLTFGLSVKITLGSILGIIIAIIIYHFI